MDAIRKAMAFAMNVAKNELKEQWNKAKYAQGWNDAENSLPRQKVNDPSYTRGYDDYNSNRAKENK
jgi:hypothetical protein